MNIDTCENHGNSEETYAIRFENVSKRYRLKNRRSLSLYHTFGDLFRRAKDRLLGRTSDENHFHALKDVSFQVRKGEVLGIIGPNGAGKSTTLKLLSHVTVPTEGTIDINGKVAALIEVGAGFHAELTGRENIFLNAAILGLRRAEVEKRFDEIVHFAGLERFIDTPVKRYSSGMYARLGFSVAAHVDADILLVDEVLSVGDANFQVKCFNRMQEIRRSGKTIVIVSHNLSNIKKYCDRCILLRNGEIAAAGDVDHVVAEYHRHLREANERSAETQSDTDKPIRITGVRLIDSTGEPRMEFETGEQAYLLLDYEAKERITDPAFGVSIRSADGAYLSGITTKMRGDVIDSLDQIGTITFRLDPITLFEGTYSLTAWAFNGQTRENYDYHFAACHLAVVGPPANGSEFSGYSCLPHRWFHNNEPVGNGDVWMAPADVRSEQAEHEETVHQ